MILLLSDEKTKGLNRCDIFNQNIMAKYQISITVDEDVLLSAKERLRDGTFRNKSHLFEYAVRKLLEGK